MAKITVITTILNEERTIGEYLDSLFQQSKLPNEIVIVDGGSNDNTLSVIGQKHNEHILHIKDIPIKVKIKKGNRSVGRNYAVSESSGDIILCADGDNILDVDWVKEMVKAFTKDTDVVAGYYKGMPRNIFEKCLTPYVLVMPDKVNPKEFLPASRSLGFTKKIFEKVGGFPQDYSHNEDYVFAHALKHAGAKIVFAKDAIVFWRPRATLKSAYTMFYRFALGDAEAGIYRKKVLAIYARYIIAFVLLCASFILPSRSLFLVEVFFLILYIVWAIFKNYRYVKHYQAFYFLPLLQFTSDIAVLRGTTTGILNRWDTQKTQ